MGKELRHRHWAEPDRRGLMCFSLALELIPLGIRVKMVSHGACDTSMVTRLAEAVG